MDKHTKEAIRYLGKYAQHKPLLEEVIKTFEWFEEMDKNITALEGNNGTRVYYDDGTVEELPKEGK